MGSLMITSLHNHCRVRKNFENRATFAKVMGN